MNLQYNIEAADEVLIFRLSGKIITETDTQEMENEFGQLLSQKFTKVILNLNELTHINSTGIAMMIKMITKTRILGGDLLVCNIQGNVAKIFDIAKLDEVFTIYSDEQDAVAYFKQ